MKTVKIRGKKFRVKDVPALRGKCEHPQMKEKTIAFPINGDTLGELTVIIHECIHAGLWDLAEEAVDDMAYDVARVLWRLKWRREI